jgi:tetratricopeptide (TPR) repeat protein
VSDKFGAIAMDKLITAAGRALAAGDPLGALTRVALREDAPALALRGIAMAQLGDLDRAKALLRRAARGFGPREAMARARCVVAEAEIALVSRDIGWPGKALEVARTTLERHGDRANAAYAQLVRGRLLLLIGRVDDASRTLGDVDPQVLPPASRAAYELAQSGVAIRRLQIRAARDALDRAEQAARRADIPALSVEVDTARDALESPAARLISRGSQRLARLDDVEALLTSDSLVVDACRHVVRSPEH